MAKAQSPKVQDVVKTARELKQVERKLAKLPFKADRYWNEAGTQQLATGRRAVLDRQHKALTDQMLNQTVAHLAAGVAPGTIQTALKDTRAQRS